MHETHKTVGNSNLQTEQESSSSHDHIMPHDHRVLFKCGLAVDAVLWFREHSIVRRCLRSLIGVSGVQFRQLVKRGFSSRQLVKRCLWSELPIARSGGLRWQPIIAGGFDWSVV